MYCFGQSGRNCRQSSSELKAPLKSGSEDFNGVFLFMPVKTYHTLLLRCCRAKILQGFSYCILLVDQFSEDDFLCTVTDAVHGSYPCHLIVLLHVLCHALSGFHLLKAKINPANPLE